MNIQVDQSAAPGRSAKEEKREARKHRIAESALSALSEYGYAKTTLRDIAKRTDLSLGMLHYYFASKEELLIFCVKRYKDAFVADINLRTSDTSTQEQLVHAIAGGLVTSLIRQAETHRLWYDMRAQAMFDPVFQPMVSSIETALRDLFVPVAEGDHAKLDRLYAATDGLFRLFLQRQLAGETLSPGRMEEDFKTAISRLL